MPPRLVRAALLNIAAAGLATIIAAIPALFLVTIVGLQGMWSDAPGNDGLIDVSAILAGAIGVATYFYLLRRFYQRRLRVTVPAGPGLAALFVALSAIAGIYLALSIAGWIVAADIIAFTVGVIALPWWLMHRYGRQPESHPL